MSTEIVQHTPTTDLATQMKFAELVTSGHGQSLLPDAYRGNPANVLIAVGLGAAMGLSPAESLYRIAVIKGKPSAGAELIAANVRKAGHKLRVTGDETTCTATIIRADDPEFPFAVTRDMAWAKGMGLAQNDNYKKQPGTMLQWRAISAVARLACPEALYGVTYTPDEITDYQPHQQAAPQVSAADFLSTEPSKPPIDVTDAVVVEDEEAITPGQLKALHASLNEAGITEKAAGLAYYANLLGHDVSSSKDLTRAEASRVIDALKADTAEPAPDDVGQAWVAGEES